MSNKSTNLLSPLVLVYVGMFIYVGMRLMHLLFHFADVLATKFTPVIF